MRLPTIGFTLQRDLSSKGYHCDVIAPSSLPTPKGRQIKTDRVDAQALAQYYANNLLSVVRAPERETEQDRDFMRSRQYILEQLKDTRNHIQSLMRRQGKHFTVETKFKSHWTRYHIAWLESTIASFTGSLKRNLELLFNSMKSLMQTLEAYNEYIDDLAKEERYRESVQSLICYKGIKNIFALTMITEIGDINRFSHPRQRVSWMGMDIREYSSGGKHHRFGITKHGNRYLRTAFVEANQRGFRSNQIGKELKARRRETSPEYVSIADRCLRRLTRKGNRLILAGKHPNKVKGACAREMVGFVWESLKKANAST